MSTELDELRKEYELSHLGDRPHSISATKLRRLIELERAEAASREDCADCFGNAALCVDVCGAANPVWNLARQIAAELDRQALLYASKADQSLTGDELASAVVVIAGALTRARGGLDAATAMRDKCVEKVREMRDQHNRNYEYWKSIASDPDRDFGVLKFAAWAGEDERVIDALQSLTLDQVKPEKCSNKNEGGRIT